MQLSRLLCVDFREQNHSPIFVDFGVLNFSQHLLTFGLENGAGFADAGNDAERKGGDGKARRDSLLPGLTLHPFTLSLRLTRHPFARSHSSPFRSVSLVTLLLGLTGHPFARSHSSPFRSLFTLSLGFTLHPFARPRLTLNNTLRLALPSVRGARSWLCVSLP
eukprot:3643146-Rhodomonas_salina.1